MALKFSMLRRILLTGILFLFFFKIGSAQSPDTTVYLITCGPGTETYSIYGHSALRVEINKADTVYNWGIFDFSASNFAWKFAKGRLDYYLGSERFESFLQSYFYEKRFVLAQKINLDPEEKAVLLRLINENLKPENIKYRYDFFYDDCSTRIRDLIEKAVGDKLVYPVSGTADLPTFRQKVGEYQKKYPWLQFGVDMIMGSPGEEKAGYREQMFLPEDLKKGLSEAVVTRTAGTMPLLQDPDVILDFDVPVVKQNFFLTPLFIFSALLLFVLIFTILFTSKAANEVMDIMLFSVFSLLAILMIFFNFFTDHLHMRSNYNIIWLNPFLLLCLFSLLSNRLGKIWFRVVFTISVAFLAVYFFLPQAFNIAIIPLVMLIILRSLVRSGFRWNPFPL